MQTEIIENGNELDIRIKNFRPTRYLDEFLSLRCAGSLINLRMFPDAKEITETMGMWSAIRKDFRDRLKESIHFIDIGCSKRPRNAALVACLTKWKTYSIDPQLEVIDYGIDRLNLYKEKAEDILETILSSNNLINNYPSTEILIISLCHSHAPTENLRNILDKTYSSTYIFSMPCCVQDHSSLKVFEIGSYEDPKVWSPKRQINIYKM